MTKQEMKAQILRALYEACFTQARQANLDQLRDSKAWEGKIFDTAIDELMEDGQMVARSPGNYQITASGVRYAEEHSIIPDDIRSKNKQVQDSLLAWLGTIYEKEGPRACGNLPDFIKEFQLELYYAVNTVELLQRWGYLEERGSLSYRITKAGRAYNQLRKRS